MTKSVISDIFPKVTTDFARIIRGLKFASRFNFKRDEKTRKKILDKAGAIKKIKDYTMKND